MDSDSSLSTLSLMISIAMFAFASVAEASAAGIHKDRIEYLVSQNVAGSLHLRFAASAPTGIRGLVSLLRALSLTAAVISSVLISISIIGQSVLSMTAAALLVLIATSVIRVASTRIALVETESTALRVAFPLRLLAVILMPILMLESAVVHRVLKAPKPDAEGPLNGTVSSELSHPLDSSGVPLDEHEVKMIRAVVELDKTTAREIMVPRVDMIVADIETSIPTLADLMVTSGHSRIPIFSGDLDHIEGISHAMDILGQLGNLHGDPDFTVKRIIRPPLFIPESKTLEELLGDFQDGRVQMAVVVDEYGGVSGLVTIEDLLEEIVGEIQDEFDKADLEVQEIEHDVFIMDARIGIDDLNRMLGLNIESSGFDTLGGFVFNELGKIPSPGDLVNHVGMQIEVESTVGRRVKRLKVSRVPGVSNSSIG